MPRAIAWWSESGGSGKTTNAVNSAVAMGRDGVDVLFLDLDPQSASATHYLGLDALQTGSVDGPTVMDAFFGDASLTDVARRTASIDVVPGHEELVTFDQQLTYDGGDEYFVVRDAVAAVADDYDVIVIDTKASLDMLLNNALFAGTNVMVPLELSEKGDRSLRSLEASVDALNNDRLDFEITKMGLIPSRVDQNTGQTKHDVRQRLQESGYPVPPFEIPDYELIQKSWNSCMDLFSYLEAESTPDIRPYQRTVPLTYALLGRWMSGTYDYDEACRIWRTLIDDDRLDPTAESDPHELLDRAADRASVDSTGRLVTDGGSEKAMPGNGFEPDTNGDSYDVSSGGSTRQTPGVEPDKAGSSSTQIPHRIQHDSRTHGRSQLGVYVADEDKRRLAELEMLSTDRFDRDVYAVDVYLAALRAGMQDEDAFLEAMEEIGYGF